MKAKRVKVIDDPSKEAFPTALENANKTSDVYVGRIRSSKINNEDWISCWIVADNVFGKGAALNAVQILELMKKLMKIKKISFSFFIIFSSLLSSEITYISSKTFQDENTVQIVISINSTEEIDKSDISIFEYQTSSSIKDSLFNLSLSKENISEYNLSFEKLKILIALMLYSQLR